MTDTLSPEQQELLDYLAQKRIEFEDSILHGREKKRGKYLEWAWNAVNSGNALTRLPVTMFRGSRSAAQVGFDRVILGTTFKSGTVDKLGIRPDSDYRIMEHDDGEFVLLNVQDEKVWDEYEAWLVSKQGVPAFKTEYSIGKVNPRGVKEAVSLDKVTAALDEATKDRTLVTK